MRKLILWTALCLCLISFPTFATDYYVDDSASDDTGAGTVGDPKKTIQAGINLAASGDTVWVAAGTYSGVGNVNLNLGGDPNDFIVKSAEILGATIDGGSANVRGFSCSTTVENDSIIDGFIITGCDFTGGGGGINVWQGAPIIKNCCIKNNSATTYGGGINIDGATAAPIILNSKFEGNHAGQLGGGIYIGDSSAGGTLINVTITGNSAGTNRPGLSTTVAITITNLISYGNTMAGMTDENQIIDTTLFYSLYDYVKTWGDTPDPEGTCLDGGSVDPLLTSDFNLRPNSPCINAGTKAGNAGFSGFQTDINDNTYYFTPYDRMNMGADQTYSDADVRPTGKGRIISGILR